MTRAELFAATSALCFVADVDADMQIAGLFDAAATRALSDIYKRIIFVGGYDISHFPAVVPDAVITERDARPAVTEYSLTELIDDFGGLYEDVQLWRYGELVRAVGWTYSDDGSGSLWLPDCCPGNYHVRYVRLPPVITSDTVDFRVYPGTEQILSLLCASYIWLDDESDKAAYYYKLYERQMAIFLQRYRRPARNLDIR